MRFKEWQPDPKKYSTHNLDHIVVDTRRPNEPKVFGVFLFAEDAQAMVDFYIAKNKDWTEFLKVVKVVEYED